MTGTPYPEKFWHCYVTLPGTRKEARKGVVNDLSLAQLHKQILDPWRQGISFTVAGVIVSDKTAITEIRIVHTPSPKQVYSDDHFTRMSASGIADLATDSRFLPFGKGTDYTNELLFLSAEVGPPQPDMALILHLCERLPLVARLLASRKRAKAAYEIDDEYDVQDLLHAVIRGYLKYSVDEEPLGKVGGVRSARADIAIADLGILIELKYVSGPTDQQRLVEEFAQDLLLYSAWPPLKTFVYLVYNASDLRDPEALQRLQGETVLNSKKYRTYIILA